MIRSFSLAAVALAAIPSLAAAQEPPATVTYDKGFTLRREDFELKIVGRVQTRYELHRSTADDTELEHRFSIPRARLTLEGTAYDTGYKLQTEFGKGFVYLRDFYLDRELVPGLILRAGQWKRPFSRQHITSSASLQLPDRALTDDHFQGSRDLGVQLHSGYEKSPDGLEWAVGVFNGTGDKPSISASSTCIEDPLTGVHTCTTTAKNPSNVPADIGPMVVARLGWNHGGIKGYSESDLEGGPLRFAVGASYRGDLAEGEGSAMVHAVEGDFLVKVHGASLTGGVYARMQEDVDTDLGFHLQGGWFVSPRRAELVARYGQVPDERELLGGFNWFLHGHALKWQTVAGVIDPTADGAGAEVVVQTQAQLVF